MQTSFDRALAVTEKSLADGRVTGQEAIWLGGAWIAFAGETLCQLADPESDVDPVAVAAVLLATWGRVAKVIDKASLPWHVKALWTWGRAAVPGVIEQSVPKIVAFIEAMKGGA